MNTRYRVEFEMNVFDDRDPHEWDWTNLIDIDDDVDSVDFSTLRLTMLGPSS